MQKILIYFPFPLRDLYSGSTVRPRKILEAFRTFSEKNNIELIEIVGSGKDREKRFEEMLSLENPSEILFCYMENSSLPIWLTDEDHIPRVPLLELNLIKYLKKHKIPLGLFYRDAYWMFDEEYPLKGFKKFVMRSIYKLEYYLYKKNVKKFFLPSMQMNRYVRFPEEHTSELPPGGEENCNYKTKKTNKELNIIYVGGISERYGIKEMLEAISLLRKKNKQVRLHLVCREDEYNIYRDVLRNYEDEAWLKIYHAFGDQLKEIYKFADIAIIPIKKNRYNDFAVPVKLFEYISNGLPVISTNCEAQANIINNSKLGIVTSDQSIDLAKAIEQYFNTDLLNKYAENVDIALHEEHLWYHRVNKIYNTMMEERGN